MREPEGLRAQLAHMLSVRFEWGHLVTEAVKGFVMLSILQHFQILLLENHKTHFLKIKKNRLNTVCISSDNFNKQSFVVATAYKKNTALGSADR